MATPLVDTVRVGRRFSALAAGNTAPMNESKHNDPKQTWSEVGDAFAELGRLVRERYKESGANETTRRMAGDAKAAGDEVGDSMRRALDHFVAAARDVGERASELARDETIKTKAKEAGWSLGDALSSTMETIVAELSELFRGDKGDKADRGDDPGKAAAAGSEPATPLPASDKKPGTGQDSPAG